MEEKPNYFAVIPANVRYDKNLRANEKLLYGEITALTQKTGECWASNSYFSKLYETTPQAISKWINNLKKCGYLEIEYQYIGKEVDKRIIRVSTNVYTYQQNDNRGINKMIIGYQQMFKENNTSNNNTSINNNNNNETDTLFDLVEQNFGRTLNSIEYEKIEEWEDNDLTRYAIKKAVLSNKYNINYICAILKNYELEGIKTIAQAQEFETSLKLARNQKKEPYWLNQNQEKNIATNDELKEMEDLLKEFKED